ncbi:MAG: DUF1294 domain-containing protein [Lachnospiraceae bacterium]|nr:DUF1294 domain-containing protein [Lachnospiraceae bacterium]
MFQSGIQYVIAAYFIIINLVGFALMGMDKRKARKHLWRIPEKTLFLASIIGGSVGTLLGMYVFHHKTKHWYFVVGMPLILIIHIIIFVRFFLL